MGSIAQKITARTDKWYNVNIQSIYRTKEASEWKDKAEEKVFGSYTRTNMGLIARRCELKKKVSTKKKSSKWTNEFNRQVSKEK